MPFTFCHPAIVLPLGKLKYLSLTALVLGAMMPDFEYFMRMKILAVYGHSVEGIFLFCLPLGLLLSFVFHCLVRDVLIDNLPLFLKARFIAFKSFDWIVYVKKNLWVVIASFLIGSFSHIFWDAFTHPSGWFVVHLPLLRQEVPGDLFVYKVLQHSSSLIGGLVIAWYVFRLPPKRECVSSINYFFWITQFILTLGIVIVRFALFPHDLLIGHFIASLIGAYIVALVVSSLAFGRD